MPLFKNLCEPRRRRFRRSKVSASPQIIPNPPLSLPQEPIILVARGETHKPAHPANNHPCFRILARHDGPMYFDEARKYIQESNNSELITTDSTTNIHGICCDDYKQLFGVDYPHSDTRKIIDTGIRRGRDPNGERVFALNTHAISLRELEDIMNEHHFGQVTLLAGRYWRAHLYDWNAKEVIYPFGKRIKDEENHV